MAEQPHERKDLSLGGREPCAEIVRPFKSALPISRLSEEAHRFWIDGRYSKASPMITEVSVTDCGNPYRLAVTERLKLFGGLIQTDLHPVGDLMKPSDMTNGLEFNAFAYNLSMMKEFMTKFTLRKAPKGGEGDFELVMQLWFSLPFYAQPGPLLRKITVDGFKFSHTGSMDAMAKYLEQLT